MSSNKRLRWQCRRGMRELDVLLSRYLEEEFPLTGAAEKSAFERLLELSDPDLVRYLLKGESSGDPDLDPLLRRLRR